MMEHEPESIELNRRLNPASGTRIPRRWGNVSINKQHLILDDGSPTGILPTQYFTEYMPNTGDEGAPVETQSLLE